MRQTNYFECNGELKLQISGTVIGTKFESPYGSIFMHQVEFEV